MNFEENLEYLKKDLHIQQLFPPSPICASYVNRIYVFLLNFIAFFFWWANNIVWKHSEK